MQKWFLASLAAGILATSGGAWAAPIQVTVNGQPVYFDQPPVALGGRVLVPVRGVFQSLGANVVWTPSTRTVTATRGQDLVVLQLGARMAQVDGQNRVLDEPAQIIGGRTLVPLRFISEALGAQVQWVPSQSLVAITSGGQQSYNPAPPPPDDTPDYSYPLVSSLQAETNNRPLFAGQSFRVRLYGDPGGQAFFTVGGHRPQPMLEAEPGTYQAEYVVRQGDDNPYAVVTGTLRMPDGEQQSVQAPDTVAIFGFSPEPIPYYGDRPMPFRAVNYSANTFWLGTLIRLTFEGPAGGTGFFLLGGQRVPCVEERPGYYYANYAPPQNYQPGVVPVIVSFRGRGESVPQQAIMPQPIVLMPPSVPRGQFVSNLQTVPPSAAGQPFTVRMTAAPGSRATFNVGPHQNIPMQEVSPGQFEGAFSPTPGQAVNNAAVTANVALPHGGPTATARAQNLVSIAPPVRHHDHGGQPPVQTPPPVAVRPTPPPPRPTPLPVQTPPPVAVRPTPPPPRPTPLPVQTPPPVAVRPTPPPPRPTPLPVQTPPPVAVVTPVRTLRLRSVAVQAVGELRPGQPVVVMAQGDAGGRATFDLGNRHNLPMQEGPVGVYRGEYRIAADDHFRNQPVLVHLVSANNQIATQEGPQRVTVAEAQAPPPPPRETPPPPRETPPPGRPQPVRLEIGGVQTNARGAFHVGDMVTITAQGTPHMRATVDLGGQPFPMRETAPGTYEGSFRVNPNQRSEEVHLRVTLTNGAETVNKDGPSIRIDTGKH